MSEPPQPQEEPRLYDQFDDAGKAWFDSVVDAFNAGAYEELARTVALDEAVIELSMALQWSPEFQRALEDRAVAEQVSLGEIIGRALAQYLDG